MFRRSLTLLLLAAFLSGQAGMRHAHAGLSAAEEREHNATPHFHCNWSGHSHHSHDHDHATHLHDDDQSNSSGESGRNPAGLNSQHHDSDAVFMTEWVGVPRSERVNSSSLNLLADFATADLPGRTNLFPAVMSEWQFFHPPDETADGSNLFLKLRALRI